MLPTAASSVIPASHDRISLILNWQEFQKCLYFWRVMTFASDFCAVSEVNRITLVELFITGIIWNLKKAEVPFTTILFDIRKLIAFWKVPRLRGFFLLVSATCSWKLVWSNGGMILRGETPKYSYKKLSQCHFVYHKSHTDWDLRSSGMLRSVDW